MNSRLISLAAVVLSTVLSACATTSLNVQKVPAPTSIFPAPAGPNGIRYSLPKPFLLVTPDPTGNGAFKVEVIYLPDECNTYAIDAKTKRGAYDLTVTVKDGLLSKVVWSQKDAELLAQSLKAGGEILKAELERVNEEKKEDEKKAEEARKTAETEIKTIEKTLNDKQLEVTLKALEEAAAQAVVDAGDTSPEAQAALRKAQLELEKARAARDFAEQLLADARARAAALPAALNKAHDASPTLKTGESPFWSPVLYAIDDSGSAVRLRAIEWKANPAPNPNPNPKPDPQAPTPTGQLPAPCTPPVPTTTAPNSQIALATAKPPKEPAPAESAPKVLGSTSLVRIWRQGALRFTLTLDKPVNALLETDRRLSIVTPTGLTRIDPPPYQAILGKDRQSIRIEFPGPPLAAGEYQLQLFFTYGKTGKGSATILLTVQK